MRPRWRMGIGMVLFLLASQTAWGFEPQAIDPTEWVTRGEKQMRGDSNQMEVTLQVITPAWQRSYQLRSWMMGMDQAFVRVMSPPKIRGQAFLKIKTRFWQYLPSTERTILIPPSLMLEKFMGSDFSNDDFVKMSYLAKDYTHRLLGEEDLDGFPAYRIELLPKPEAAVVYGKLILWLRKQDASYLKMEFYNEHMELLRTLFYSEFRSFGDREYPALWKMVNHLEPGRSTVVTVQEAVFNEPLDPKIFTQDNLKQTSELF